jgi:hypothetical protein
MLGSFGVSEQNFVVKQRILCAHVSSQFPKCFLSESVLRQENREFGRIVRNIFGTAHYISTTKYNKSMASNDLTLLW